MPRIKVKANTDQALPLKLSTSGSYKVINDLNKSAIEYRQNITLMVTAAKEFAKQVNANIQIAPTNYRVHVKQNDKLICIVSKNDIEWQAGTEHLQSRYFPDSDLAKRLESMFAPTARITDDEIKTDELDDEIFLALNAPNFK